MKTFPTIYARGNNKKILTWSITVDGTTFSVTAGQQDGKKVTAKPTLCTPKNVGRSNATTAEDQALLEAEAKWEKKIKSGGYWENVDDIDKVTFIEPMLAKKLEDRRSKIDISKGLIVQLKFNGMRCIATKDGLFTRTGERYASVPHIEGSLISFFAMFPDAVLDGELFNMELREQLNEIAKLIRRTEHFTPEHFAKTEKLVRYYVYDGWGFGAEESDPYKKRKLMIDTTNFSCPYIMPVEDEMVYSWEQLDAVYQTFVADNHEGAIARIPDSPYERKRTNNLLKIKPCLDDEFEIISIEEGQGNWSGVAKIVGLKTKDGKFFNATFKGTMAEALECLQNKSQWIGKIVTIQFNGMTGLNCPQYAQFDYKNCLKGDR